MREIKFRAWDKVRKRMFEVTTLNFPTDVAWLPGDAVYSPIGWVSYKKDCVVMQFTGLKDKNGKKIYEGDIIKHGIGEGHEWSGIHEVVFMHGAFMIRGGKPHGLRYGEAFNWYPQNVEVIGNIYENPELLKGN